MCFSRGCVRIFLATYHIISFSFLVRFCFLPGGGLADLVADAELEKAGDLASEDSVQISYVAFLLFSLFFTQECSMHVLVDEPMMLDTQSILNH